MSDSEKDIVKKVNGEPAADLAGSEDEELTTDEAQAIAGGAQCFTEAMRARRAREEERLRITMEQVKRGDFNGGVPPTY